MDDEAWIAEGQVLIAMADRNLDVVLKDARDGIQRAGRLHAIAEMALALMEAGHNSTTAFSISVMVGRLVDLEDKVKELEFGQETH